MKQVSLLSSLLLLASVMEAASLQDPIFTDNYYDVTSPPPLQNSYSPFVYRTGGINNNGVAVGVTFIDPNETTYAGVVFSTTSITRFSMPFGVSGSFGSQVNGFLYSNGSFTNLFSGLPTSINDAGDISLVSTYHNDAILYPDGTLAVIHFTNGGYPSDPVFGLTGVNNAGEIVGISYPGTYFATPVPEPKSVLLVLAAAVGCLAVRRLRF